MIFLGYKLQSGVDGNPLAKASRSQEEDVEIWVERFMFVPGNPHVVPNASSNEADCAPQVVDFRYLGLPAMVEVKAEKVGRLFKFSDCHASALVSY